MAQLLALNFAAFIVALAFGAAISTLVRRLRAPAMPVPSAGASLRIRADAAVYRSRFLEATAEGWVFAAPLQRDAYVPLRVGEDLVVEAEEEDGRLIFRSQLVQRCAETGRMVMSRPKNVFRADRSMSGSSMCAVGGPPVS
ncbi:MAG: flagellar brake protein [Fimbriimonas sp.]